MLGFRFDHIQERIMPPILGCIADDFTGATDLANMLVRGGLRTVQLLGVPEEDYSLTNIDAVIIALKSRTIQPSEAILQSLKSLKWLRKAGTQQFFFKYCSTFDSTDKGNIGPVTEALMAELDVKFTIANPAFPETGRTVFKGHLFVGDSLLSDTHMNKHPLTPMTESNLVTILEKQTQGNIGLIQHNEIEAGPTALKNSFKKLTKSGFSIAVTDSITDKHLHMLGEALADFKLITGGSGIAIGLPENYRKSGLVNLSQNASKLEPVKGPCLILSGSCSQATLNQIAEFSRDHPSFKLNPIDIDLNPNAVKEAISWAQPRIKKGPVLIYASASSDEVKLAQKTLGADRAGSLIENAMGSIAKTLVDDGVRRLVVAGGETAGAVVGALKIKSLQIGEQIDPGVPGTITIQEPKIALALKSGNFGTKDFFQKALKIMP